jgi:hypothetical protein
VRLVVVVVIEKPRGQHPIGGFRAQPKLRTEAPQADLELSAWNHSSPGSLIQFWQFRRPQQVPKGCDTLRRGGTSHRESGVHLPTHSVVRQIQGELRPCSIRHLS